MSGSLAIRSVTVTRYIAPLREGGSLPALVEADDGFKYVLKFRGAGQGVKALIAELIGGELARRLGLRVPEIVFATLDAAFGRTEPDEEIQDLLKASTGLNLALHYLTGALMYDPAAWPVEPLEAATVLWLDALITNVDRTARNPNLLLWRRQLWLIDHGASLYFHHSWDHWQEHALRPFKALKDHVLITHMDFLRQAHALCSARLSASDIHEIVECIPDEWLSGDPDLAPEARRAVYAAYLELRWRHSGQMVEQLIAQYLSP